MSAKQTPGGFVLEFTGTKEKVTHKGTIEIDAKCPFVIVVKLQAFGQARSRSDATKPSASFVPSSIIDIRASRSIFSSGRSVDRLVAPMI